MTNVTPTPTTPLADLVRLVISFAIGLTFAAALFAAYYLAFDAPTSVSVSFGVFVTSLLIALALGLPVLVVACAILFVFHKMIIRNLAVWCVIAQAIVVAMYLGIDQIMFNKSGSPIIDHLTHESVTFRAITALTVSFFTTVIFYFWRSRTKAVGEQASESGSPVC